MPTTSIHDSTSVIEIASHNNGGTAGLSGKVLWAEVRDGIDGNRIAFFDARNGPEGAASVTDTEGNVWTIGGTFAEIEPYLTQESTVRLPSQRRSNIVDYDNDGSEKPVTGLTIIGEGEGDDQRLLYVTDTSQGLPLYEGKQTFKDMGDTAILLSRGQATLDCFSNNASTYTLELDWELEPKKEDMEPGDFVRLVINDRFTQVDDTYWIGRKRITLTDGQDEKITLEVTT